MVPTQLQNRFTAWREMTLVTPLKWTIPRWAYLQLDLTFRCLSILGILTLPMFAVGLRSFAIALSFLAVPVLVVVLAPIFRGHAHDGREKCDSRRALL